MKSIQHLLFLAILLLFSCGKEETPGPIDPPMIDPENGVLISNEGGFGFNNASLSFYQFDNQQLDQQLFATVNGRQLGDVLQSITFHRDLLYLVVNNSNRIEIVDPQTFELQNTIDTFNSPRYLLPIDNEKAYVSDLYEDAVYVVDLVNNRIRQQIVIQGWTEEMALFQDQAFVTNRESDFVYVIDTNTDQLVDSIQVGFNSNSILLDKNDQLWVYCSGDSDSNQLGGLFRIDPSSNSVTFNLQFDDFDIGGWPRMAFNGNRDTLYYLKEDLFQLPIDAAALPTTPLVVQEDRIFYALGVRPSTGTIFLGDAIDYQQRGRMLQYDSQGRILLDQVVGIIPNGFYFY
ncbi:MAG: DUF5074 domain-containing protein [Bacteroidota bacterium]